MLVAMLYVILTITSKGLWRKERISYVKNEKRIGLVTILRTTEVRGGSAKGITSE